MLCEEIINHMNEDELRNYIIHLEEAAEKRGELVFAQDEIIRRLQHLADDREYKERVLSSWNRKQTRLVRLEEELEAKYIEFLPRPACGECEVGKIAADKEKQT